MKNTQIKIKNANALYALVGIAFVSIVIILGVLASVGQSSQTAAGDSSVVSVQDGVQYIDISARAGGYYPNVISAKSGMKTVVRFTTNKAYGCETAMTIPSLGITKNLPPTGVTEVEIGNGLKGNDLLITCLMRMYSATVRFS